jgi:phospholipase C
VSLDFINSGKLGAVFHVYDRLRPEAIPRRYTVEPERSLQADWPFLAGSTAYDLWILGPNGFHRRVRDAAGVQILQIALRQPRQGSGAELVLHNLSARRIAAAVGNAYGEATPAAVNLPPMGSATRGISLSAAQGWYDVSVTQPDRPGFLRRFAGRAELGRPSISDPLMGGAAIVEGI